MNQEKNIIFVLQKMESRQKKEHDSLTFNVYDPVQTT